MAAVALSTGLSQLQLQRYRDSVAVAEVGQGWHWCRRCWAVGIAAYSGQQADAQHSPAGPLT